MVTQQKHESSSSEAGCHRVVRLWKGLFGSRRIGSEFLLQELDLPVWHRACCVSPSLTMFLAWQLAALWGVKHLKYF